VSYPEAKRKIAIKVLISTQLFLTMCRSRAAMTITEAAAKRLRSLLEKHPESYGVRLSLKQRGCNGLSYQLDYAKERRRFEEEVVSADGRVRVLVDPRAMLHVVGTEMDYVENDLASEFVFRNPNAKGTCGCGESFNV
jgi:iron-sulfur cluster assembly accessory protein